MKGTWVGYYQYDHPKFQKASGFEKTYFTITITSFNGKQFTGIVNDDAASGGMEGTGEIIGEVEGENIYFQKYMPREMLLYGNGERAYTNKKHPALFYRGLISNNGKEISGVWKFKLSVLFLFGFIPVPYKPGKGTFNMSLQ